jgi:hypothetical protein
MVYHAWRDYFNKQNMGNEQIKEFATFYYLNFINILSYTFDARNKDSLQKKLKMNNHILYSKEFIECLELADTSKEDLRYLKLLQTKNYYLVWLLEQVIKLKKKFFGKKALIKSE